MIREGITGLNHADLSDLDQKIKLLKTRIYQLAHYKIDAIIDQDSSSNYHRIKLTEHKTKASIDLLVNCPYGYTCCVTAESSWMNLAFITMPPPIQHALTDLLPTLTPADLNAPITADDLSLLSEFERKQVAYWGSKTVGEVIFNGYD